MQNPCAEKYRHDCIFMSWDARDTPQLYIDRDAFSTDTNLRPTFVPLNERSEFDDHIIMIHVVIDR